MGSGEKGRKNQKILALHGRKGIKRVKLSHLGLVDSLCGGGAARMCRAFAWLTILLTLALASTASAGNVARPQRRPS